MSTKTTIEWTRNDDGSAGRTWNPVSGCTKVSPGCDHCYAENIARRFAGSKAFPNGFEVTLHPERLNDPLRWRKPTRVFVNSMSDLFHDDVPDEYITKVFAVMAATPQHQYMILTKRHARMRALLNSPTFVGGVRRELDALTVQQKISNMGDESIVPIAGFPGYFVSDRGHVYTANGSTSCVWCSGELPSERIARRIYCTNTCRQEAHYAQRLGRWQRPKGTLARLKPLEGESGHQRVMLYRDGEKSRQLIHRLVLQAFVRPAEDGEQGCHHDGDPTNNALPNLRWDNQGGNRDDLTRQGGRTYRKLTDANVLEIRDLGSSGKSVLSIAEAFDISDTQVRNILSGRQWAIPVDDDFTWPLPSVSLGVSCEDQKWAETRIPALLETPAATRFISAEPLLGPIDLRNLKARNGALIDCLAGNVKGTDGSVYAACPGSVSWVIAGAESGPGARPMDLDWVRDLRDQCDGSAAFFFKQNAVNGKKVPTPVLDGRTWTQMPEAAVAL